MPHCVDIDMHIYAIHLIKLSDYVSSYAFIVFGLINGQ
jgi:hypothetical protein